MESRFVGRAAELAVLVAALEGALAGRGGVALVSGEPGIGKTRLVAELARLAAARAVPVFWGRCTSAADAPAYWPWRRILRAWHATADPAAATAALAGAEDLARIAPELGPAGPGGHGPADRFALFDLAAGFFTGLAAPTGAVLVLDDVQWADPASLALLAHLGGEVERSRLLLAVTFRSAEVAADPDRARVLAALAARGVRLELAGLAEDEIAAALAGYCGGPPARDVVADVARRSGGNPFFVGELARVAPGERTLPAAAREVVVHRMLALPPRCQELLAVACVLGLEVDVGLLAAVLDASTDAVLDELSPAFDDGLLERVRGGPGLRFAHDLVREVWLDRCSPAEVARVHHRVTVLLAPAADDPAVLPDLARHALAAQPLGDPGAAVGWLRGAAALASGRLAYEEAARLLGEAARLARGVLAPARRGELLLEAARAHAGAHEIVRARTAAAEAADLGRALGDPQLVGCAALVLPGVSEPDFLDEQRAWCTEALRGLPDSDSPLRAQLLAQLAHVRAVSLESGGAEDVAVAALAMAGRLDDPVALGAALRARQLARAGPDGMRERLGLGERMIALATRTDDGDCLVWGHLWRFDALVGLGRTAEAEAVLDGLEPVVASLRRPMLRLHLLRSRVALAFGRGDWDRCRELNGEALVISRRGGHEGTVGTAQAIVFQIAALTGRDEPHLDVDALRAGLANRGPHFAIMGSGLARWLLDHGERDEARRWYEGLPAAGSPGVPPFSRLIVETSRIHLADELGDGAGAEAARRVLAPHADLFVTGGAGATAVHGSVHRALGVADALTGRTGAAIGHLRAAVAADDAAGLAPFAALGRHRLADLLRGRDRPGDANEAAVLLAEAGATAARLEMAPLRELVAAANPQAPVLSRREAEIAELVARGLTNRQIAAGAHISERTVETHVQHILAKLGFGTRSQIAAWVARRTR
ncbi:MAG: AAA family ATPase [Pseudonocardia sp.]